MADIWSRCMEETKMSPCPPVNDLRVVFYIFSLGEKYKPEGASSGTHTEVFRVIHNTVQKGPQDMLKTVYGAST